MTNRKVQYELIITLIFIYSIKSGRQSESKDSDFSISVDGNDQGKFTNFINKDIDIDINENALDRSKLLLNIVQIKKEVKDEDLIK